MHPYQNQTNSKKTLRDLHSLTDLEEEGYG
jgi:hypothetical protein